MQGKAKGTPSGVKTLFSAWNSVGKHKVRLGTPAHALPHGTPAFNDHFYKMLKYMFFGKFAVELRIHRACLHSMA